MLGCVRLYLDPDDRLPLQHRQPDAPAVIEVDPEHARAAARDWRRRGYRVLMVAL